MQTQTPSINIDWTPWQSGHSLYAIVDGAQLSEQSKTSFHQLNTEVQVSLFEGTPDQSLHEFGPLLLNPLAIDSEPLLSTLLQQEADGDPVVVWLVSSLPLRQLAPKLRDLLSVDLPGSPDALLRFYDPRVLHKLMAVLSVDQRSIFDTCGPQWWAWHSASEARKTYKVPTRHDQTPKKLELTSDQMEMFDQMDFDEFVQRTKAAFLKVKSQNLHTKDLEAHVVERLVGEHIQKAIDFGFESEEAIVDYLHHVVTQLGWDYEEKNIPRVMATLHDDHLTEDEKLALLKEINVTDSTI